MSDKDRGELEGAGQRKRPVKPASPEKKAKKQKSSDLGRALRSVYDDTLRESVPDEFLNLLGRLS